MRKEINDKIDHLCTELKLPSIKAIFKEAAEESSKESDDYEVFLLNLLTSEYDRRVANRKKSQLRQANFPNKLYLEDLKRSLLPSDAQNKLPQLERLDFIDNGQNIILSGNPGTGKTHIAIGLGVKACLAGYRVLFTTVPRLLTQLRECHSEKTLRSVELKFEKYDLVICDEFGYISFDKQGAELLFNHLSLRASRKSTIITTNLGFDRWEEIFGDSVLTAALVDRLTHKASLINMNGDSYRMRETQSLIAEQKQMEEI